MDISQLRERGSDSIMSVSELNSYVKRMFDTNRLLTAVTVRGEVSNFVFHRASGHLYFSLKDGESQIKAVMFRSAATSLKFNINNGMRVIVSGAVSVYVGTGSYQIYVKSVQPDGIGALYLAYEQLRRRLGEEGLFSDEYKKPIPNLPRTVGVITSATGAAVRDIINVIGRRYPLADIYLYPSLVQGDGAEESLISALDFLDRSGLADLIIIGRGGGSIEDLWAFNGERLARRIFSAKTPIISAVGHETDFTICDFVADLRAPTPSAAAELAVPDIAELLLRIDSFGTRAASALSARIAEAKQRLTRLSQREFFVAPNTLFDGRKRETKALSDALSGAYIDMVNAFRARISVSAGKLEALSPLSVLSRGYSVVEKDGKIIKHTSSLASGDEIIVRLSDGKFNAVVGANFEYEK